MYFHVFYALSESQEASNGWQFVYFYFISLAFECSSVQGGIFPSILQKNFDISGWCSWLFLPETFFHWPSACSLVVWEVRFYDLRVTTSVLFLSLWGNYKALLFIAEKPLLVLGKLSPLWNSLKRFFVVSSVISRTSSKVLARFIWIYQKRNCSTL